VTILYQNFLLRAPSPAEVAFQTQGVQQYGRIQIAENFLYSQEFQQLSGPQMTAFLLYACLLQRAPFGFEVDSVVAQLNSGMNLSGITNSILTSREFTDNNP
jgi:hypothetical protein